jgi:ABC-type multidrug transport system fused ATPase/permease subunit
MNKEFSFYEFVGVLVPSIILLYFAEMIMEMAYNKSFIEFETLGESVIFIVIAYGFGHILNSVGNIFEKIVWGFIGGMPTSWLNKSPRFRLKLFDSLEKGLIQAKIQHEYEQVEGKDYCRLLYNKLYLKEKTGRIDIFNGNYSLFRGLTVTFLILTVITLCLLDWLSAILPFILALLAFYRMLRFAKYYAKEVYRTYLNIE